MKAPNSSHRRYYWQLLSAATGLVTSLYLLVQHTRLKTGIQGESFCNLGRYADCNVVNSSPYSEVAGIPLAALGALYFLAILVLGAVIRPGSVAFARSQAWMARVSLFALFIDCWLLGIQAFALTSFCLFCLITYLASLGHLGMNWLQLPAGSRNWKTFWNGPRRIRLPSFALATVCVVVAAASLGMFRYIHTELENTHTANIEKAKEEFLQTWSTKPARPLPVKPQDGIWGNPQAKIQIVVFSDFECPHCQKAAFALHTALTPEEKNIKLVFKNFPLDNACNPVVPQPMHPNACALARLGYCANKKGRFWDYHDRVFFKLSARELSSSQDKLFDGVKPLFSRKEFDDCLADPESAANTTADIALGKELHIDRTPAVFINGKRIILNPTVDLIRELVEKERHGR